MNNEGQNLKPTLEWLRRNLALMDGCCLDNSEDVEAVAQHLLANWIVDQTVMTTELLAALVVVEDYFKDREKKGYFDRPWAVVETTLARYREQEMKP